MIKWERRANEVQSLRIAALFLRAEKKRNKSGNAEDALGETSTRPAEWEWGKENEDAGSRACGSHCPARASGSSH